jgi:uncharacterized phage protein (TIGR02220 family)
MLLLNWYKYNWTASEKFRKPLLRQIEETKDSAFREYLMQRFNGVDTVSIPYEYGTDTTIPNTNTYTATKEHKEQYPYEEVVEYLNKKTGKAFSASTKETRKLIKARFDEKRTLEDFKKVIDNMTEKWKDDAKMSDYLRPQTLFGTKFEAYLNATPTGGVVVDRKNRFNNFQGRTYDFSELERNLLKSQGAKEG